MNGRIDRGMHHLRLRQRPLLPIRHLHRLVLSRMFVLVGDAVVGCDIADDGFCEVMNEGDLYATVNVNGRWENAF